MPAVYPQHVLDLSPTEVRARFHALLDAALAFGACVVLWQQDYTGDLRADMELWQAQHADVVLVNSPHVNATELRQLGTYHDVCRAYWSPRETTAAAEAA